MNWANIYYKYAIGASIYSLVRKPIVLQKHKIRKDSSYDNDHKYRHLLVSEVIPLSISSAAIGMYIFPIFLCKDVQNLEIKMRGLQKEFYDSDHYNHDSLFDMIFI